MYETLMRLRRLKNAAVERMQALNALAKKENRDLTDAERKVFESKRDFATDLNAAIADLEPEAFSDAAPATNPAEEREARRARFVESMRRMDDALGIRHTC